MSKYLCLLLLIGSLSGCSSLVQKLGGDLDEDASYPGPTTGGQWADRGFLESDDGYGSDLADRQKPQSRGLASDDESLDQEDPDEFEPKGGSGNDFSSEDNYLVPNYTSNPNLPPPIKRKYKSGGRATRADFIDDSTNESSLWASDGQTNYYFTKNKIRGVGDLVTITIEDGLVRDVVSEITRTLNPREKDDEIALAQERIRKKVMGLIDEGGDKAKDQLKQTAAAAIKSAEKAVAGDKSKDSKDKNAKGEPEKMEPDIPKATWADVDVAKSVELKNGDQIMAEVVERYPNGNYKIRGTKKVRYKNGYRLLTLVGVAKGTDISEEDVVNSGKLYEYRLEVVR